MAKFLNGPIGTFSGKVGSIIGSNWRDVPYMRGLPKKRTKPFSEGQLAQQQRFSMMGKFLLPLKGLLEIGLANQYTGESTLFNVAMALNLPAVGGSYPDFVIDYSEVKFSTGGLLRPRGVTLAPGEHVVNVSWRPTITAFDGNLDDEVYILLYDTVLRTFYTTDEVMTRSAGEAEIEVDDDTAGHEAAVWLFSVSRDGKRISETVFAGKLTLE